MDITPHRVYFICGIDTDVGKTYATGLIAKHLRDRGVNAITQKIVQTGVNGPVSDDIAMHRKIMGLPLTEHDLCGDTCPYIFHFPASPHLAARKENREIDTDKITEATEKLLEHFEVILLEGAGGLNVPLRDDLLLSDYVAERNYPMILVSSGKLGSINHTLLTLESAALRKMTCLGMVYNHFGSMPDLDSLEFFRKYGPVIEIPILNQCDTMSDIDFSPLFL